MTRDSGEATQQRHDPPRPAWSIAAPGSGMAAVVAMVSVFHLLVWGWLGTTILVDWQGWGEGIGAVTPGAPDRFDHWFARWDSGYYRDIAGDWYPSAPSQVMNFFPLYALLVRGLVTVSGLSIGMAGLLVSTTCFVLGGVALYKYAELEGGPRIAFWTVIWLCVFPPSLFFVAFYAESLFLLATSVAMYSARRGAFIAAGTAIAVAGATRPQAFLLAIPYALEFVQGADFSRRRVLRFVIGGVLAPLGSLAYLLFLARAQGQWNIFTAYQAIRDLGWSNTLALPTTTWLDGLRAALLGDGIATWFSRALAWHDLAYASLAAVLTVWALLRLRLSSSVFALASILLLYANHGPPGHPFWSISRYVATIIPLFVAMAWLSMRLTAGKRHALVGVSALLQGLCCAWFTSGRWVG